MRILWYIRNKAGVCCGTLLLQAWWTREPSSTLFPPPYAGKRSNTNKQNAPRASPLARVGAGAFCHS